jgi:hypothetical protein
MHQWRGFAPLPRERCHGLSVLEQARLVFHASSASTDPHTLKDILIASMPRSFPPDAPQKCDLLAFAFRQLGSYWPGRVASSPTMAVRRRRKRIARNEDAPPCQTPVGSLRFPLAIALRRDALPRQPVRHLAIIVADLSYRCLDEGGIGESVVVGARPRCERRERACARSGRMLWNPALRFL